MDKTTKVEKKSATTTSHHERRCMENQPFVELVNAWEAYEKIAKPIRKNKNAEEANFTMFGVGCSFADSPSERDYRTKIMDQACRGWFSSGSLPLSNNKEK